MDQPQPTLVRGRCACGKRYRIRNAQAGITVMCPNCRRPIPITSADLSAAVADAQLIPVQTEVVEPREVIPIYYGELRLAAEGSRPGLTGKKALDHEEAMLEGAARGGLSVAQTFADANPGAVENETTVVLELEPVRRAFVQDLVASFYFAGIPGNALNVLAIAAACSLLVGLQYILMFLGPAWLLIVPVYGLVFLYVVQFYWSVLRITSNGEDVIPWAQTDWSFWHDGFKPLFWMGAISALCCLPRWLLGWFGPPQIAADPVIGWVLLGACWFLWPVAVMSVALGNTILFARPDWLVRCVIGIGPVYLAAWVAVMIAVAGWYAFWQFWYVLAWIPVLPFAINLYFGYVVFRTLGLLFRHFRARFPWKY